MFSLLIKPVFLHKTLFGLDHESLFNSKLSPYIVRKNVELLFAILFFIRKKITIEFCKLYFLIGIFN